MSKKVVQSSVEVSAKSVGSLVGRFDHSLDPKKRLTVPSEWRMALGSPEFVYVMPDAEKKCLNLIPREVMEARVAELQGAALMDDSLNAALQVIGESSELLQFDVQGRIRICDKLLAYANLNGTVAMVGAFRMAKLWNPKALGSGDKVEVSKLKDAVAKLKF